MIPNQQLFSKYSLSSMLAWQDGISNQNISNDNPDSSDILEELHKDTQQ